MKKIAKLNSTPLPFAFILVFLTVGVLGCKEPKRLELPFSADGLRYAARDGRLERVQKAIDSGTDVNLTNQDGATALMLAAFNGHTRVVELLLKHGANVNHVDNGGRTALMYAATDANLETLKLLIDSKINIDATENTEGFTALMFATAEGHIEATKLLLSANADTTLADKDGDTAESFALKAGHQAVADLFQEKATESESLKSEQPAEVKALSSEQAGAAEENGTPDSSKSTAPKAAPSSKK